MDEDLEWIWQEVVSASQASLRHLSGRTEGKDETLQAGTTGILVHFRSQNLPNASLVHYLHINMFGLGDIIKMYLK
jgi:hypothetical protein